MKLMDMIVTAEFTVEDASGVRRRVQDSFEASIDVERWLTEANARLDDYCQSQSADGWLSDKARVSAYINGVYAETLDGRCVTLMQEGRIDWSAVQSISDTPALSQASFEKLCFEHEGMTIWNPFVSECGRFEIRPGDYGFTEEGDGNWVMSVGDRTLVYRCDHPGESLCPGNARAVCVEGGKETVTATLDQLMAAHETLNCGAMDLDSSQAPQTTSPAL